MGKKRLTLSISFIILLLIFVSCSQGAKSPEDARRELGQMNIDYSEKSFVERAGKGDIIPLKLFLNAGMNPNVKEDYFGHTALIAGAEGGHIEIVKFLISKGADLNLKSKTGDTALICAIRKANIDIATLLITSGADVNIAPNDIGVTPLMLASGHGNEALVTLLIKKGANLNAATTNMQLLWLKSEPMIAANIKKFSNIIPISKGEFSRGITAIDFAKAVGHNNIVQLLQGESGVTKEQMISPSVNQYQEVAQDKSIIGLWEPVGQGKKIEFFSDKTLIDSDILRGQWIVLEDGRVKITSNIGVFLCTRKGDLLIIHAEGKEFTYKKVKK
jgi:hypothetical protein